MSYEKTIWSNGDVLTDVAINKIENALETLDSMVDVAPNLEHINLLENNMEQGNINSSGNSTSSTTRIRSKTNTIFAKKNDIVTIRCGLNQRFYCWRYYEDGRREKEEDWVTTDQQYIMTDNCQIRLLVSHQAETANPLTPADNLCKLYVDSGANYAINTALEALKTAEQVIVSNQAIEVSAQPGTIISVAHRGYKTEAPENTMPAFILARNKGFRYVETDLQLTSDNILVLSHDATIDACSNGNGTIHDMTYEELLEYDFGSWFGEAYTGTKIPTFEEFIKWCRDTNTRPYIELKLQQFSAAVAEDAINICKKYRMLNNCTWITSQLPRLERVSALYPAARLGWVAGKTISDEEINAFLACKTPNNEIFIDANFSEADLDATSINRVKAAGLPLEVYGVTEDNASLLDDYISGATSDDFHYAQYKQEQAGCPGFYFTLNNKKVTFLVDGSIIYTEV